MHGCPASLWCCRGLRLAPGTETFLHMLPSVIARVRQSTAEMLQTAEDGSLRQVLGQRQLRRDKFNATIVSACYWLSLDAAIRPLPPFHEAHTMDPPRVASAHFPMGRRGPGMGYDAHLDFPPTEAADNGAPDHAGPRKRCRKRAITGPALDRLRSLSIPPSRRVVSWPNLWST
jgi:hypothetical protein